MTLKIHYTNGCSPSCGITWSSIQEYPNIYRSKGMKEAWAEIKAHPQVTVTVDLFWIGLVFFRKGQEKEGFKIRV